MREILRLVIAMVIFSSLAAFALAKVDDMTKAPIAENKRKELVAALKEVLPPFDNDPAQETKDAVVGKDKKERDIKVTFHQAKQGGQSTGVAFKNVNHGGYAGDVWVLVGVDMSGTINSIKVVEHHETPGLGDKYVKQSWYDQFKGKNLDNANISVKKDGGNIDYTTGATITARAATTAVKEGLEYYRKEFGHGQPVQ